MAESHAAMAAEIAELKAKLAEAEKRTSHVAENLLGRQMLPLTKNECEALLHSVFTADPSPVLMTQDELAEVKEHWERFAKDENKMDAAWLAFNLGPLLDHSQLQSVQIEKVEAEYAALREALKEDVCGTWQKGGDVACEGCPRHTDCSSQRASKCLAANPAGAKAAEVLKAAEALERLASKSVEPRKAENVALNHLHELARLLSELYKAVRAKNKG